MAFARMVCSASVVNVCAKRSRFGLGWGSARRFPVRAKATDSNATPSHFLSFSVVRIPPSENELRFCAKTMARQDAYFRQNDPHPAPLPSDGRGNSQTRLAQFPKRLDTPTDGGRFSRSHPMGEGRAFAAPKRLRPRRRGEGERARKSDVIFARALELLADTEEMCIGPNEDL